MYEHFTLCYFINDDKLFIYKVYKRMFVCLVSNNVCTLFVKYKLENLKYYKYKMYEAFY